MKMISMKGVRMQVVHTHKNGVVNHHTIFSFKQESNKVSAEYAGGLIVKGYLVGLLRHDQLEFSFCQLQSNGRLDNGISTATVDFLPDGRLRLIEKFTWHSRHGESGTNIFEQIS